MTCFSIFLILILTAKGFASQIHQERATINICNNNYLTDCNAITRRLKRGEIYKTNFTVFNKYPMGNNVTMRVTLHSEGISVQIVSSRLCDIKDIKWLHDFYINYTNFGNKCPFPVGALGFYNMEFSPKNVPQSIVNVMKGKVLCKFFYEATKTQDILLEASLLFRNL